MIRMLLRPEVTSAFVPVCFRVLRALSAVSQSRGVAAAFDLQLRGRAVIDLRDHDMRVGAYA